MWIAFCEECGSQYTLNPDEFVHELQMVKCKKCNSVFEVRGGARSGDDQREKTIGYKPVLEYTPQIPINPPPSLSNSLVGQFSECSIEDLTFEDSVLKALSAAIPASLKDDEVSLKEIGALNKTSDKQVRNPRTDEAIKTNAASLVRFKGWKGLKEAL